MYVKGYFIRSVLWKSDDWMSVWIGFLILAVFLAGATLSLPKWNWMGNGSFQGKIAGWATKVEAVAKDAEVKNEAALKEQAVALKTALDGKDRKAIGEAAGKMETAAKEAKDNDVQILSLVHLQGRSAGGYKDAESASSMR